MNKRRNQEQHQLALTSNFFLLMTHFLSFINDAFFFCSDEQTEIIVTDEVNPLWVCFYRVNLCSLTFAISEKIVLDPNGPYVELFQTNLRNVYMSVILEFCVWLAYCLHLIPCRG